MLKQLKHRNYYETCLVLFDNVLAFEDRMNLQTLDLLMVMNERNVKCGQLHTERIEIEFLNRQRLIDISTVCLVSESCLSQKAVSFYCEFDRKSHKPRTNRNQKSHIFGDFPLGRNVLFCRCINSNVWYLCFVILG